MTVISTSGLTRTFTTPSGPVEAVRSIDLTIRAGEIVGLLGPNGAGKTTTLRMLTTLLAPTGGAATVAGHDLLADPAAVRAVCGYVAQSGGVDPYLTVREELVTQGRLYRLSRAQAAARAEELAAGLGLDGLLDRKAASLSGVNAGGSTSPWASPTDRPCSSWTSPPRAWTPAAGPTCGTWCGACATTTAPPSS